jgi:hypothetical protein
MLAARKVNELVVLYLSLQGTCFQSSYNEGLAETANVDA